MITYACNHTEPNVEHRVYSALRCPSCEAKPEPGTPTLISDKHLPEKFRVYGGPELAKEFREYCKVNRIYYYARPRESFFEYEAWDLARKAGALFLLLEDMS